MNLFKKSIRPDFSLHYFYAQRVNDFKLQVIKIHFPDESSSKKFIGVNLLNSAETICYSCLDDFSIAKSRYDAFCYLLSNLSEVQNVQLYYTNDVCELFDFIKKHQEETWDSKMQKKFDKSCSGLEPNVRYKVILDNLLKDPEVQNYLKYHPMSKIINFVNQACYPERFQSSNI